MKRNQRETEQKTSTLALRRETLRQLDAPELREVIGAGRLRVSGGYADDTTPIEGDDNG
jgi:hypothetical protein